MVYEVKKTNNTVLVRIPDGVFNSTTTSLTLMGKRTKDYGNTLNENFIKLLENFANVSAPLNPLVGQIWFDSTPGQNKLKFYNGSAWNEISVPNTVANSVTFLQPVNLNSTSLFNDAATFTKSADFNDIVSFNSLVQFNGTVFFGPSALFNFTSNITFSGNNAFTGVNTFTNSTNFNNLSTFNGNTIFNGTLTFNSGLTFSDEVNFSDTVNLNSTTNINGSATFTQDTTFNGSLTTTGSFIVNGVSTFNNNTIFNSAINLSSLSSLTIQGSINFINSTINGDATFNDDILFNNPLNLKLQTAIPAVADNVGKVFIYRTPGNDANTVFLTHFDSPITDVSSGSVASNTVTLNGAATITTRAHKFPNNCLFLTGAAGAYASINDNVNWDFSTGPFTIDFWAYARASGATQGIFYKGNNDAFLEISLNSSNKLVFNFNDNAAHTIALTGAVEPFPIGQWCHIALERTNDGLGNSTFNLYQNGTVIATTTVTQSNFNLNLIGNPIILGRREITVPADYFNGYLDEMRISNVGRYSNVAFSPLTSPYTGMRPYFLAETGNTFEIETHKL